MSGSATLSPVAKPEDYQGSSLLVALPGYLSRCGTPLTSPIGPGATVSASVSAPNAGGNINAGGTDVVEELRQARREIELLKSMVISRTWWHACFHFITEASTGPFPRSRDGHRVTDDKNALRRGTKCARLRCAASRVCVRLN